MLYTPALWVMKTIFPTIIEQESQTGDVTGGYGNVQTCYVQVLVNCERCDCAKSFR